MELDRVSGNLGCFSAGETEGGGWTGREVVVS